jgi:hypothetical protein
MPGIVRATLGSNAGSRIFFTCSRSMLRSNESLLFNAFVSIFELLEFTESSMICVHFPFWRRHVGHAPRFRVFLYASLSSPVIRRFVFGCNERPSTALKINCWADLEMKGSGDAKVVGAEIGSACCKVRSIDSESLATLIGDWADDTLPRRLWLSTASLYRLVASGVARYSFSATAADVEYLDCI